MLRIATCLGIASLLCLMDDVPAADATPSRPPLLIVNEAADGIVNFLVQRLNPRPGQGATREAVLAGLDRMVDQYEGTGVTHLFWNVNYQRAAYDSKAWPSYWDVADAESRVTEWPRNYYELHKLGIDDVFARLVPRTRQRGLSPWASFRMNDHHYTGDPTRVSPLFFDHPELRLRGGKGLFNYARPEVREHYLKLIGEVLTRYDIDGVELDWIRTPDNFEAAELERGRTILTDFVRAVRAQTNAATRRLGHPVQVGVRVPARPEFALAKGFDVAAWAREDLIDLIIPSDWWSGYNDMPIEQWRQDIVAGKPIRIVPGTAATYACTKQGYAMVRNLPGMRGFAAAMYDRGADGIYLFNHFEPVDNSVRVRNPASESIKEGTLADLLRVASDWRSASRGARVHALAIHDCLPARTDYRAALPVTIEPGKPTVLRVHTGPRPSSGRAVLRVGLDKADGAAISVMCNDQPCRDVGALPLPKRPDPRREQPRQHVCEVAPRVLQFEIPLESVQRGYNAIKLTAADSAQTVIWLDMLFEPKAP